MISGRRVYRCWSAAADLLWIGQTMHWANRRRVHCTQSPWWHEVAHVTFSGPMSEKEALRLEREFIRAEAPLYNVHHNRSAA